MQRKKFSLSLLSLFLILILMIAPVSASIFYFYRNISHELENTAKQTVDFYMNQFTTTTESMLDALRGSIFFLTTDSNLQTIMQDETIKNHPDLGLVQESSGRIILSNSGWWQNSVSGIYLFKSESDYIPLLPGGLYSSALQRIQSAYTEFENENSSRKLLASSDITGFCYIVTDYIDMNTMRPLGKIVIEINTSKLINNSYLDALYAGHVIYLSDAKENILFGNMESPLSKNIKNVPLHDRAFITVAQTSYYHARSSSYLYDLRLDVFIPEEEIIATANQTIRIYILFSVFISLLILIIGISLYIIVTKPLRQMLQAIDSIATGDLSVRMTATPYRETDRVVTAFNSMADNLDDLFDEVYHKGLLLKEAEFSLLESQINPHFIFNVLEVINMRAMAAGQTDTCRMVSNLAKLLRSNVSNKNHQKITFGEELSYVQYYLELQKERFSDSLTYQIDIEDDEILSYYLPKLTIQPLVENSVVHGLENKRGGGMVRISIWEENDNSICVRIFDNGIGFDASSLVFEDAPLSPSEGHTHVALYNINRRIQLLYGAKYHLAVESTPEVGTIITLTLPIETNGDTPEGEKPC